MNKSIKMILGLVCVLGLVIYNLYKGDVFYVLGFVVVFVGAILNTLAVCANNGQMPVELPVVHSDGHVVMDESTRFKMLCDIFPTENCHYSIGDFILFIGAAMVLVRTSIYLVVTTYEWVLF